MDSVQKICRFCFNTYDEDLQPIQDKQLEMMQVLCITLDLNLTENPFICSVCQKKLEDCHNFKKLCMHTEDCINPYVVENVKVNLKEISSQEIVKSDDGTEPNICRLCLQPADNDMTLSSEENEQFEQFFPEINLHATNFVILCTKCYGLLQKLFIFVSTSLEWEEKLHSFSEGDKVSLDNFLHYLKYQNTTKDEEEMDIIDEKMRVKEELEDFGDDMDEKSEEVDEKFMINSELDIKDEGNDEAGFLKNETSYTRKSCDYIKHKNIVVPEELNRYVQLTRIDTSETVIYNCKCCDYRPKRLRDIKKHVFDKHVNPPDIKMYKCEHCNYLTKHKGSFKRHVLFKHTDPSQIRMYKCEQCDYQAKVKSSLQIHYHLVHADPSTIEIYRCDQCDFKTKIKSKLNIHQLIHVNPSALTIYKCDVCSYQSKRKKNLKTHSILEHTDPSESNMYNCEECDYQTESKVDLLSHIEIVHSGPSSIFKCDRCGYETTHKGHYNLHTSVHLNISTDKVYKCERCNYRAVCERYLKQHMVRTHSDPSDTKMYACEECNFRTKFKASLNKHVRCHSDPSKRLKCDQQKVQKSQMVHNQTTRSNKIHKCVHCDYATARKTRLKSHSVIHADPSQVTIYKCDKCKYESKFDRNLRRHVQRMHGVPYEVKVESKI